MADNPGKQCNRRRKPFVIWLFFLPFLLIGFTLLGLAAMKVVQHVGAQSWQPVHATLLERGQVSEKTSTGSDKIGGAARVGGAYSYQWQGKRYQSAQLSFSSAKVRSMGMSPDDWDARIDAIIGEPGNIFRAWVNPANPAEAVVVRDLRWFEIAAMMGFGLLLVFLMSAMLFGPAPNETDVPGFSWRAVGIGWVAGIFIGVLVPLLWRDGHPVWAAVCALPLLLALHGTIHGIRHARS